MMMLLIIILFLFILTTRREGYKQRPWGCTSAKLGGLGGCYRSPETIYRNTYSSDNVV